MKNSDIIISGIHFNLHDGYKSHIFSKCDKLLSHEKRIEFFQFELEKDLHSSSHSKEFIAKGRMGLNGNIICLSAKSDNMYNSIDLLIGKFDRSLRKNSRIKKFKRKLAAYLLK